MMSDPIVQLTAADFEEALDFLNLVFSVHGPIRFQTLLPKLYKPTDTHMGWNYAIKRNGRIRAIIGLYPMELNIGGATLKGAGIGAVAAHPNDKGQGHMKRLMRHHLDKMKTDGDQFSWLAGQRQRYGYFGYEVCGRMCRFFVSKDNIRHVCQDNPDISFVPVKDSSDPHLERIEKWHNSFPIHVTRPLSVLWDILQSWRHEVFVAINSNRDPVGYLCADVKNGVVFELGGAEDSIKSILAAWVNAQNNNVVTFLTPALPGRLVFELSRISDTQEIRANGSWQIFDWQAVISATLVLKSKTSPMVDGILRLEIIPCGVFELGVNGPEIWCRKTHRAPDVSIDALSAHRLLFGPLSPAMSGLSDNTILNKWCPLPLFMPKQDEV